MKTPPLYGLNYWTECLAHVMDGLVQGHGIPFPEEALLLRDAMTRFRERSAHGVVRADGTPWLEPSIPHGPFARFSRVAIKHGKHIQAALHPAYQIRKWLPFRDVRAARACAREIVWRLVQAFGKARRNVRLSSTPMLTQEQKALLARCMWEGVFEPFFFHLKRATIEIDAILLAKLLHGSSLSHIVGDDAPTDHHRAYVAAMSKKSDLRHAIGQA